MIALYAKFALFRVLALLPGDTGEAFETRYLWAARKIRARSSHVDFSAELGRLGDNSVAIDLGANVGAVTQQIAAKAGHVHAFEPDPWAFEQLQQSAADLTNVTLHKAAAGSKDGTTEFLQDPDFETRPEIHSQGTSVYSSLLWDQSKTAATFEAQVIDLRRFIRELGSRVSLLKIDIEGGEVDLLEHLVGTPEWDLIDAVFVETHECQIPQLRPRIAALRQRLKDSKQPRVYLDWH